MGLQVCSRHFRQLAFASGLIGALGSVACVTDGGGEGMGTDSAGDGDTGEPTPYPFPELEEAGITEFLGTIEPSSVEQDGGITQYTFDVADGPVCLRGEPFTMATRPSDTSNDLLIFLQGGGACWSDLCQAAETAGTGVPTFGALNQTLGANPFKDWDVGYVPYCDGALFAGEAEYDDDMDGQIDRFHHGLTNLSAAYDAIKAEYPDPDRVVLVGASAGSYGTIFGAAVLRAVYPEAEISVVSDAGLGLGKPGDESFLLGVLGEWNVTRFIPDSCTNCTDNGHITAFITWLLDRDPKMRFAAITAVQDFVIGIVFLGLDGPTYEAAVRQETAALESEHGPQYRRFLFEGLEHTVVGRDSTYDGPAAQPPAGSFDETAVGGITPAQWLGEWLDGDADSVIWE